MTGRRLLRLQCYEGQDETKALYEWDYGKQLLYTQMLREKINTSSPTPPTLPAAVDRIAAQDGVFFSEQLPGARPLLEPSAATSPSVLLIDEVDRADEALEAVFLECLAEYQVSIPEIGTYPRSTALRRSDLEQHPRPVSRAETPLPAPVPRLPDAEREAGDRPVQEPGYPTRAARQLVRWCAGLRELPLRKSPSISETIDWARTLTVLGVDELDARVLADTANIVRQVRAGHAARGGGHAAPGRPEPRAARRAAGPRA